MSLRACLQFGHSQDISHGSRPGLKWGNMESEDTYTNWQGSQRGQCRGLSLGVSSSDPGVCGNRSASICHRYGDSKGGSHGGRSCDLSLCKHIEPQGTSSPKIEDGPYSTPYLSINSAPSWLASHHFTISESALLISGANF